MSDIINNYLSNYFWRQICWYITIIKWVNRILIGAQVQYEKTNGRKNGCG